MKICAALARHTAPWVLVLVALAFASYVAVWGWLNVIADYPLEFRENVVLLTSDLQLRGKNVYGIENRPLYLNLYGIGYYWASYPFVRMLGNSYRTLRAVSLAFIAAACGVLICALRADNVSLPFSLCAGLLLFSQLGQGLSIVARPDSLGLFLFLSSLVVPKRFGFNHWSLALAAALSIAAFLTKSYFVLGAPILCVYILLFEDRVKAVIFAAGFSAVLFLVIVFINLAYQCYLMDTFFIMRNAVTRDWGHLERTSMIYLKQNAAFIIVLLIGINGAFWSMLPRGPRLDPENNWRRPLLPMQMTYPCFALICTTLVLVFALGLHPGNDILYFHQLLSPFLLWLVFQKASRQGARWPSTTLVLLLGIGYQSSFVKPLPENHTKAWERLEQTVRSHKNVFTSPHLAHLLARHQKRFYDIGHTEYLFYAFQADSTRFAAEYNGRSEAFLEDILAKIQGRQFDLVIINRGWCPLIAAEELQKGYVSRGFIDAPMTFGYWMDPFPLEVWTPKEP